MRHRRRASAAGLLIFAGLPLAATSAAGRIDGALYSPGRDFGDVRSLNGEWQIAEGTMEAAPAAFPSRVFVPGLVSQARPAFVQVGESVPGRPAFWYKRTFLTNHLPGDVVRLGVRMAMFGVQIHVNGHLAGENPLSFSPTVADITSFLQPAGQANELLIRVAAHIDHLPGNVVTGGEAEKLRYVPGIHDEVELIITGPLFVEGVQVVPLPQERRVRVVLDVRNEGREREARFAARVLDAQTGKRVGAVSVPRARMATRTQQRIDFHVPMSEARPWSPEQPSLYRLEISDGRHSSVTRFGMRTVAFSGRELRFNGQPRYLLGTNLALYRFFEDPACQGLPWDPAWVRRLFRTFKDLNLHAFRTTLGPWPRFWYDIADEEGCIIFDEYAIWYAYRRGVSSADFEALARHPQRRHGIWPDGLTAGQLALEYERWMRARWNHASVLFWDAQNETWAPETGEAINRVRALDLTGRPWDNGWSPPAGEGDYREAHSYFERFGPGTEAAVAQGRLPARPFRLDDLAAKERIPGTLYGPYQRAYGLPRDDYWDRPVVLNEYAYLWLKRDGTPTELTRPFYDAVLGPEATADERRQLHARYLAAVTEFWRASRTCFGILHVFGLAHSMPGCYTSDVFADVEELELDPHFLDAMRDAFAPVAVMIDDWQTGRTRSSRIEVPVVITNDTTSPFAGNVILTLAGEGTIVRLAGEPCRAAPWGQQRLFFKVQLPDKAGTYTMLATLETPGGRNVRSRREIRLE